MRIQLLTAYFPPEIGSASHLFHDIGLELAARGHEVSVVTGMPSYHAKGAFSRYRRRLFVEEEVGSMRVTRVWVPQLGRNTPVGRGVWQVASAAMFGLGALRQKQIDVTLSYSPPLTLGLTGWALRRIRGAAMVVNIQDLFPQSAIDLGILSQPALIRVAEVLERFVYRRADALTFHSVGNLEHAVAVGADRSKCLVVHNCVDTDDLAPPSEPESLKVELGLDGRFVASFAGVMGFSQDLDVILEVAQRLKSHSDIAFLLVGDGVEKDRLVARADKMGLPNVVWMPMQPRDRYQRILHASDVCMTTLHSDVVTPVVPSKIVSAMAAGRPIIAAVDLAGDAPKLIEEVGCGISVPPEDPDALATALLELRDSPDMREKMGKNGRRFAEEHCSPQSVAREYEGILLAH